MARILVLDTLKHPSNSGTANITLSSDETTTMPAVNINGGQIDSTTVGASTPSSVAATTLTASGNATVGGTLGVTGTTTLSGANTLSGVNTLSGATTCSTTLGVTGNTTQSGSANNIGTVTAGTVNETVVMAGVPRKTTLIRVNESAHQWNNNTTSRAVHDSISFSATNGKSYIIEVYVGTLWIWTQNTLESPFHDTTIYRHTSAKTRADTSSLGTKISAGSSYNSHLRAAQGSSHIGIQYPGLVFLATFTASATQTEYIHLVGTNGNSEVYCQYQFDVGGGLYYKIQEFDSYTYTTVT